MCSAKTYVGIDVGKKGAFAFLNYDGARLEQMPLIGSRTDKNSRQDLWTIKELMKSYDNSVVVIEKPMCSGKQGVASQCKAFNNKGELYGLITALNIRVLEVRHSEWQKVMYKGEPKRDDKKVTSAIVAQRLFPDINFRRTERCKNLDDGYTDAILMAEYARRGNL